MDDMTNASTLKIEWLTPRQLSKSPSSLRQHSPAQIKSIATSIRRFGYNVPILIDKNNSIIAGHARVDAAKIVGMETIPIIRLEHLNDIQLRAFMIADNRLSDLSDFDNQILGSLLKDISIHIDLSEIGYSPAESDLLIQGIESTDAESKAEKSPR
jgi:ParB-like chromosome segregation protein Spo0J